jgi:hypothetical protein
MYNEKSKRFRNGSRKPINMTYFECVFIALGIQHAMRVRHIVVCGLSDCKFIFPRCLIVARFSGESKMCVLIFSTTFV